MENPFTLIAEYYDEVMQKVNYEEWARYIKTLFSMAPLKPIKTVLDLASGTGNISTRMAAYGYEIFGLDYSLGMLKVARKKIEEKSLPVFFIQGNFRRIPFREHTFDGVYSTFDSLNNILDADELSDTFQQVRRILRNGGPFVFDLNTEWSLKTEWDNLTRVEETAKTISIWKSRYLNGISYLYFTLFVKIDPEKDHYKRISTVFRERGYEPSEIKTMLKRNGFEKVFIFDHFTLNPGKSRSSRVTYLAY